MKKGLFTVLISAASAAYAGPILYSVTDLGHGSYARGINSSGEIVGTIVGTGDLNVNGDGTGAAVYANGAWTPLGFGGGDGYGINDKGDAVGFGVSGAMLNSNGTITSVWSNPDDPAYALAINDDGTIVGYSVIPSNGSRGFVYINGVAETFNSLAGIDPTVGNQVTGVNAAGVMTGVLAVRGGAVGNAFVYANGVLTTFGSLADDPSQGVYGNSLGRAINNSGEVVGQSDTADGRTHGFRYSSGVLTDLGTLGGSYSEALAIDSGGDIVGWANTAGDSHAFLYSNGIMLDLNDVITGTPDHQPLTEAVGINDSGQIAANDAWGHAYILTPIVVTPEPSCAGLLLTGIISIGALLVQGRIQSVNSQAMQFKRLPAESR